MNAFSVEWHSDSDSSLGADCFSAARVFPNHTGRILGTVSDHRRGGGWSTVSITDMQRGTETNRDHRCSGDYAAPELASRSLQSACRGQRLQDGRAAERSGRSRTGLTRRHFAADRPSSETVVVTDEVPLVNTTSSTLGGTLSNEEINDLPLNGRNYENLLQLRPGVVRYPGGGFSTTSTNGLRAEDNAYFIEDCSTASLTPGRPSSMELASLEIRRPFCRSTRFRNSTSAESSGRIWMEAGRGRQRWS